MRFSIGFNGKTFFEGDYVEITPKDLTKAEICRGHISEKSNWMYLLLDDDLLFENAIYYDNIKEIRKIEE